MWEVRDGRLILLLSSSRTPGYDDPYNVADITFNANSDLVVMSDDPFGDAFRDTLGVMTGADLERISNIPHLDRQDGIRRLSPDGDDYFVRGDVAGTRIINLNRGTATRLDVYVKQVVFSGDGERLAIATQNDIQIFEKDGFD